MQSTCSFHRLLEPALNAIDQYGWALIPQYWSCAQCQVFRNGYDQEASYRKTIDMERYRFGKGRYRYFRYPLPDALSETRSAPYAELTPLANQWANKLGIEMRYPDDWSTFLACCHQLDQHQPTPLILRYAAGDYNTMHQDLYGKVYFPFQAGIMLSVSQVDYTGGELVITEQVPRVQSRVHVLNPHCGDLVMFSTQFHPKMGKRGHYKTHMKHGASTVHSGNRYTLGIIFHDAK